MGHSLRTKTYDGSNPKAVDANPVAMHKYSETEGAFVAIGETSVTTNLSAVTATGAGESITALDYNKITVSYTATSVSDGATIKLQGSNDGTNWYDIDEETISGNGTTYAVVSDEKHKYIRTNVTSRTDGTYTTMILLGN